VVVGDRNQRDCAWPSSDTCDDFGPIKRLVSNTVSLESIRLGERGVRFVVLSPGHKATARGDDGEAFFIGWTLGQKLDPQQEGAGPTDWVEQRRGAQLAGWAESRIGERA
jgi:hypothetical protein